MDKKQRIIKAARGQQTDSFRGGTLYLEASQTGLSRMELPTNI